MRKREFIEPVDSREPCGVIRGTGIGTTAPPHHFTDN
jgi:hypothetical protein